jgi:hypothetical protein
MGMITAIILIMVRRTVTLPDSIDSRVRDAAYDGESFSAAVTRLLGEGLASTENRPDWIGSGDSGDGTLSMRVEEVLREIALEADPYD